MNTKTLIAAALAAVALLGVAAPAQADTDTQGDYAMGYDAGLMAAYLYPVGTKSQVQVACARSYMRDLLALRQVDRSLSISQADYIPGCWNALGVS